MRKNKKLPSFVVMLILTTITVVFWIIFAVYNVFSNENSYQVPNEIIKAVNPTIDEKTLDQVQQRNL